MSDNYYFVGMTAEICVLLTDPSTGDPNDVTTQDPIDDPTLVVTAYKPDGTTEDGSTVRVSTGVYKADFTLDQDGHWKFFSTSTGAAANRGRDRLYVAPVP